MQINNIYIYSYIIINNKCIFRHIIFKYIININIKYLCVCVYKSHHICPTDSISLENTNTLTLPVSRRMQIKSTKCTHSQECLKFKTIYSKFRIWRNGYTKSMYKNAHIITAVNLIAAN